MFLESIMSLRFMRIAPRPIPLSHQPSVYSITQIKMPFEMFVFAHASNLAARDVQS